MFATVEDTMRFSRGLFGKRPGLRSYRSAISLLGNAVRPSSSYGRMKRRVMIAKALSHEPDILFLDEPTAGVDVSLRRDMWDLVRRLRDRGVTIILTTHYIEEAEEMADRVGVIDGGRLVLVETAALMRKLGKRALSIIMQKPIEAIPPALAGHYGWRPRASASSTSSRERAGHRYCPPAAEHRRCRHRLQGSRDQPGLHLEDIFVGLVEGRAWQRMQSSWAMSTTEMATRRTVWQSVATPVITTMLYFIVFGGAIGSPMHTWVVSATACSQCRACLMLTLLTQGISNASVAIYFPKFTHTIFGCYPRRSRAPRRYWPTSARPQRNR